MGLIIGVDPGTKESGVVTITDKGIVVSAEIIENEDLINRGMDLISSPLHDVLVVEKITSMGLAVGQTVFDTVFFTGRLYENFHELVAFYSMPRRDVKLHLCGNSRAKNPNIRQALIDKYPAVGGGKIPQVGIKKEPGPLYNIKSHCWSALALCITYKETQSSFNMA